MPWVSPAIAAAHFKIAERTLRERAQNDADRWRRDGAGRYWIPDPPEAAVPAPVRLDALPAAQPRRDRPPPAVAPEARAPVAADELVKWMLIPDCHVPYHDHAAVGLMLRTAQAIGCVNAAILGDFADFYAVSSHPKSPERRSDLEWECAQVNDVLDLLDRTFTGEKKYISGNHEQRLERYLTSQAPALFSSMKCETLFRLKERGWSWTAYKDHTSIGKLYLTHDCGKAGRNAHVDAMNAFQSNVVIGHCLPIDYEVLTRTGFKRLSEIATGDEVLAYSNGQCVYTRVNDKVDWEYDGEMAEFDNSVIRQRMTSKHHIYTKDGRYVPVTEACESVTKADLVRFAAPAGGARMDISDDWLRLVVAYAADGSRASPGSLRWHFSKPRKIERLTRLWRSVGGVIGWADGSGDRKKSINLDRATQLELIRLCPDKQIPEWMLTLCPEQRQVVIDELEHWDGCVMRHDGKGDAGLRQFCSWREREQDIVQLLLMQHGIRSRRYSSGRISYDVREHEKGACDRRPLGDHVTWVPTRERVGCISTDHQNFFVRTTEGSVELTGNTHRLHYSVEGSATGKPHVGASFGWLGDPAAVDYMFRVRAARDWAHGFGVAYVEPDGCVHVVPVPIVNGKVVVEGKVIR